MLKYWAIVFVDRKSERTNKCTAFSNGTLIDACALDVKKIPFNTKPLYQHYNILVKTFIQ
jgi:hypothetical protein